MNNMRDLLSGALPAPEDEPQQRDVIDAAMDWGGRRRRRDFAVAGAAALGVVAIVAGVAMAGPGSGSSVSTGGGTQSPDTARIVAVGSLPPGSMHPSPWKCTPPPGLIGKSADYCRLMTDVQNFTPDFAKGAAKYIQAQLPAGFSVKTTDAAILILTGPNGATNYLYPSTEPASTLEGRMLSCHTPAPPTCVQTSTEGGSVVVNGGPTDPASAGYVKNGSTDPRVDLIVGIAPGSEQGLPAPTSRTSLLTNQQLVKIISDSRLLAYAEQQLQHEADIEHQLRAMEPPSQTGSSSWQPSGSLSSGATGPSSPSGGISTGTTGTTGSSSPSDTRNSSSESAPSTP